MAAGEVEDLRRLIDGVDGEIVRLLEERMELCRRIGEAKRRVGRPLRDPEREAKVLERAGRFREVFKVIIDLCVREQGGG